jgi:hypothetical protein
MSLSVLGLTNGLLTQSLIGNGVVLAADGYAPAIATPADAPFPEVEETIEVDLSGASGVAVQQTLDLLNHLARRGAASASGRHMAASETLLRLQAAITGGVGTVESVVTQARVELPGSWNDRLMTGELERLRLQLRRRARWLATSPTATYTSTTVPAGQVMAVSGIPDHRTPSPVFSLYLGPITATATSGFPAGYLCVGGHTADVVANYDLATATATGYTAVSDASNRPLNTSNVLRYTPTGTAAVASGALTIPESAHRSPVAVLINCRNNATARAFSVQVRLIGYGATVTTAPFLVPPSPVGQVWPAWRRLGIVRHPFLFTQMQVVASVDATAGSPTLDIDSVALVALHDATSRVIQFDAIPQAGLSGATYDLGVLSGETTTMLAPELRLEGVSGGRSYGTHHDNIALEMVGSTYRGLWLATQGQYWRPVDVGTTSVLSARLAVRRSTAYLAPQ